VKVYKLKRLSTGLYFTKTCGWSKTGRVYPRRSDVVSSVKANSFRFRDPSDLIVEEYELTLINSFHVVKEPHKVKMEAIDAH
jgi:hypothetical protein